MRNDETSSSSYIKYHRLFILNDVEIMEIVVKRIAKKNTYTIGRLAERYFCDTLEPTWRNLLGVELSPQEVNVRLGRVSGKKAQKMKGVTAIPEGTYPLLITHSPSFKLWLPYVQGVPGFEGIRIHSGNKPSDTQGCILVGKNDRKGWLSYSYCWLVRLVDRIVEARGRDEPVWITII